MSYLLDTTFFSELMLPAPNVGVTGFLKGVGTDKLSTSVIVVAEISFGIECLPMGRRRSALQERFNHLQTALASHVRAVDLSIARLWAGLAARLRNKGSEIGPFDGLIAATALHHGLTVVTRNARDFAPTGAAVLDPWT